MSSTQPNRRRADVAFIALDPFQESVIVQPTEKKASGKDVVEWGDGNRYPDYLLDLYRTVTTLQAIINGNIDFIAGDDLSIFPLGTLPAGVMNRRGDTIREQVRDLAKDFEIYGGFALQVIRDFTGAVSEIHHIDMRYLRSNEENDVFWYCEKWGKSGAKTVLTYPAFMPTLEWGKLSEEERDRHASSVLFVKNVRTQVYPAPLYAAAVKACEIERNIDDFHLNALENQFSASAIINFNNGVPTDEQKEEIMADIEEKFTGHQNAGRMVASWNPNKESETTIQEFKVEDFGERYKALATHSRQQIFAAFRAIPLLFGLTSEANTGFSTDEFEQSFKLYNRTQIRPVQRLICDAYDKIYGTPGVLTIRPFSLTADTEQNVQ